MRSIVLGALLPAAVLLAAVPSAAQSPDPVLDAVVQAGARGAAGVSLAAAIAGAIGEEAKWTSPEPAPDQGFGVSVSLSGDRALVGAVFDNSGAVRSGAAYVFVRSGSSWTLETKLKSPNPQFPGYFGVAASLSGDRALIGAFQEDNQRGAAYVFVRSGSTWTMEAKLTTAQGGVGQACGATVALSDDRAVVGCRHEDESTVNAAGAVYVFVRTGEGTWTQEARLVAPDPHWGAAFSHSLSLSGDRLLVGQREDYGDLTGSAYVFVRSGSVWSLEAELSPSDGQANDKFGESVSLSGDRAVVSAQYHDDGVPNSGSAYVFVRSGSTWTEEAELTSPESQEGGAFGRSVLLSGDRVFVSAPREGEGGTVYVFQRVDETWEMRATLAASDTDAEDYVGATMALFGDRLYVGTAGGDGSGSVYVFRLPTASVVIDAPRGSRFLGSPVVGLTVDDLAGQNLVRGVPGYYPAANPPNLWTRYDAEAGEWAVSSGTGEVLQPGRGFRWFFYDRDVGNPDVSRSVALPFTLATDLPANTADVTVELQTGGTRMNYLANPFAAPLDLSGIDGWPGGENVSPNAPVWTYDPVTRAFEDAPAVVGPWESFRVKAKGPRLNGAPRELTIPASAALLGGGAPSARRARPPRLPFALDGATPGGRPLADRAFTVSFADAASPALDDADDAKPQPPADAFVLVGARVDGAFLAHDARPFAEAEVPLSVTARGAAGPLTLSWDASVLPDGLPVALVDLETGAEIDVRSAASYTFEVTPAPALSDAEALALPDLADGADAADRFVLRLGRSLPAIEAVGEVSLSPIAPNPASASARVAFAVPEAGPARVAVYDVRGREVAVLREGAAEAGPHVVALDTSALPAGVYVVRVVAGAEVASRRLTVVR